MHWKKHSSHTNLATSSPNSLASAPQKNQNIIEYIKLLNDSITQFEICGDSLFLKSGTIMRIKLIRYDENNIFFKRCSNLKSPELRLSNKEIAKIKLMDGTILDKFSEKKNALFNPSHKIACDTVILTNGKKLPIRFIGFEYDEMKYKLPKDKGKHHRVMEIRKINRIIYSNGETDDFDSIITKIKSNHSDLKNISPKKLKTLTNISYATTITYVALALFLFLTAFYIPFVLAWFIPVSGWLFSANTYYAIGAVAGFLLLFSLFLGKHTMNSIRKSPESKISKSKSKLAFYLSRTLLIVLLCVSILGIIFLVGGI